MHAEGSQSCCTGSLVGTLDPLISHLSALQRSPMFNPSEFRILEIHGEIYGTFRINFGIRVKHEIMKILEQQESKSRKRLRIWKNSVTVIAGTMQFSR